MRKHSYDMNLASILFGIEFLTENQNHIVSAVNEEHQGGALVRSRRR